MVGKTGTQHKNVYMKVQNNIILFAFCMLLSGCATTQDPLYFDTQKSLNRDYTMTELARISALADIARSSDDPNVKIQAIRALTEKDKPKIIEPKKSWFER